MDILIATTPRPTTEQPLRGVTMLLVEDSRIASEAVRLLCSRSGARLLRADSLASARRHLGVYRPACVIVDLGLPDGSGTELIADLATAQPRIDILLGMSGDPWAEGMFLAAGADGFLPKPLSSLAFFQDAILSRLPLDRRPRGPRRVSIAPVVPNAAAYHADLARASHLLARREAWGDARGDSRGDARYIGQFLGSVAASVGDKPLAAAAAELVPPVSGGQRARLARLRSLLQERLRDGPVSPLSEKTGPG